MSSRAIAVIGMHRSGTSAVARGLQALGVYLGNDFLDAQPENPTGYWEDRGIVELNERVLKALNLTWDDAVPIVRGDLTGWRMWRLRRKLTRYLRQHFTSHRLWGFKDPRTMRILPFWRRALREAEVDDSYLLVVRNPASVAASLFARQAMDAESAYRLWLVHAVPFLDEIAGRPLVVVDYDLLMQDPRAQLERIGHRLGVSPIDDTELDRFAKEFLDTGLRHTVFGVEDIDASAEPGRLTRDAYGLLYELADDSRGVDSSFWSKWKGLVSSFDRVTMKRGSG